MQKVGKEEKQKAKKEKQKSKLEKEKKLKEKREKATKLKEEMQKVSKKETIPETKAEPQPFIPFQTSPQEKQESFVPFQAAQPEKQESDVPNLFQTLSQKAEQSKPTQSASFIPFGEKTTTDKQETSRLRIIPNVADIDKDISQAPSTPPLPETPDTSSTQSTRKDIIICPYCGAMLSSDYAFCNKCGAKLE